MYWHKDAVYILQKVVDGQKEAVNVCFKGDQKTQRVSDVRWNQTGEQVGYVPPVNLATVQLIWAELRRGTYEVEPKWYCLSSNCIKFNSRGHRSRIAN